ncbi:MAG: FtsX-like permease family protein [Bacteroidetes bacterium]|nr:FtsX-like permease family protein [Bacteroidota bacterium]
MTPVTGISHFKIFLRLMHESLVFAFQAIIVNKVRTILSLLGITIGIFSIISIFTIFDSMENSIRKSIDSLGDNVLFIQKWPWAMGGDYPWWKYINRPEPTLRDIREIEKRSQLAEATSYMVNLSKMVKFKNNYIENATVFGVSHDYDKIITFEIASGRYFSPVESVGGKNVAIIGSSVSENLFAGSDPVGKRIKVFGRLVEVIGVFKKEGEDMFGNSSDNIVLLPLNYIRNLVNMRDIEGLTIMIKGKPGISNDQLKDELTGIMRSVRSIRPAEENDFAINEKSIITQGFDQLFQVIATVGWIIGGFSLLVGGFGIANIMFVSVRERTNIIGIQKAIGAKNYFVMFQFLFEAIFLSIIGGIFGLLIVFLLGLLIYFAFDMELLLSIKNILLGVFVSAFIGLLSGIIPAYTASRLDPVEAMRTGM